RRLGGSAARRLGGSAARRLGGSAARRLGGNDRYGPGIRSLSLLILVHVSRGTAQAASAGRSRFTWNGGGRQRFTWNGDLIRRMF
ncbi:hypothetical protein, partial [Actinoplanes sp. NPDC026623]|uniref:hypothetical protein n=1 Tax=Actinoplanes sp. NPDC026623 TaxID=3155610 RepID=UPI0033FBA479